MIASLIDWWGQLRSVRAAAAIIFTLWTLVAVVVAVCICKAISRRDQEIPARCKCGCESSVHEHFRAGTDCGRCGSEKCPWYRPAPQGATVCIDGDETGRLVTFRPDKHCGPVEGCEREAE